MEWHNSQIKKVELEAKSSNMFHVRFPDNHELKRILVNGADQSFDSTETLEIALKEGDKVLIKN